MKTSMNSQVVYGRRWLGAQKPLTNVRIGWFNPTEEREHLNIEKLTVLVVIMPIYELTKLNMYVKQ